MTDGYPVVVVTGGGTGIGAAVAEELGRNGWFVVTVDPLVTLDGSEADTPTEATTADRILAAGGQARASSTSVTDRDAVVQLFQDLVAEHGRVDAVVNAAGISRPTSFTTGTEEDWQAVLSVHLQGYLNVLAGALPVMAAQGSGRILGVTSGSGWRQANAGAYGCAKRAVASLTWQLGPSDLPGVSVNAMSPIAVTRMVTAALGRAPATGAGSAATGGLALGSMPAPEDLGPIAAHLVDEDFAWCTGEILFVGGSEVARVAPPKLIEVVRTDDVASLPHLLEAVTVGALVPAEAAQASGGGSNPRFGPIPAEPPSEELPSPAVSRCAVIGDDQELIEVICAELQSRGVEATWANTESVDGRAVPDDFTNASELLRVMSEDFGEPDGIVLAPWSVPRAGAADGAGWERVLAEHEEIVPWILHDAAWMRAVSDRSSVDRTTRVVTLADARSLGGRSRAQVSAQLSRAAKKATKGQVAAFAVSMEGEIDRGRISQVAAHLLCSPAAIDLAGAELAMGPGWFGLRSHPHPGTSVTYGGPEVPAWFDDVLRQSR